MVVYHLRQRFHQITFLFHLARDLAASSNVWIPGLACSTHECLQGLFTRVRYLALATSLLHASHCMHACPYLLTLYYTQHCIYSLRFL